MQTVSVDRRPTPPDERVLPHRAVSRATVDRRTHCQTTSLGISRGSQGKDSRNVAKDSVEHERLGAVLLDRLRTERDLGELLRGAEVGRKEYQSPDKHTSNRERTAVETDPRRVQVGHEHVGARQPVALMNEQVRPLEICIVGEDQPPVLALLRRTRMESLEQLGRLGAWGGAEVEHVVVRLDVHEERRNHRDGFLSREVSL